MTVVKHSWTSPTRTGARQPIPLEIYDEIFSYLMPSQDDAFPFEAHRTCFLSLCQVCTYFAAVGRRVIWENKTFGVEAFMRSEFARSVAKADAKAIHIAQLIKKCRIGALSYVGNFEELLEEEEEDIADVVARALAFMPIEELTIIDVMLSSRVLKLVAVLAPKLKVLTIEESCCLGPEETDDELKAAFGAMHALEQLKITGDSAQHTLMQTPSIIPVSSLRRLYTDALFTVDSCVAQGAALTHLEVDGMDVLWHDTRFLDTRLQSFPSLTHVYIHDVISPHLLQLPMDIPVDDLPNLISFKAPPGLLPKFHSLGPKLQFLDCTGTNDEQPYAAMSHPTLGPSSEDFTATNIRELVLTDCNINSVRVVPPVDKPTPHLKMMRLIYTGTVDGHSDTYTVPKMFEELGTMCEARTTRFPVEELVITFQSSYFTRQVRWSTRDCSWVVDLKQQLAMIEGLSDGLPKLKRVLFHGGFLAWVKDEDDGGQWKPRMLNVDSFRDVKRLMASVYVVDYMGCLEPFCSSWEFGQTK